MDSEGCLATPMPVGNPTFDEVFSPHTMKIFFQEPDRVIWDGPGELVRMSPIVARFQASPSIPLDGVLTAFYQELVGIRAFCLEDIISEFAQFRDWWVKVLRRDETIISATTRKLYPHLHDFVKTKEEKVALR